MESWSPTKFYVSCAAVNAGAMAAVFGLGTAHAWLAPVVLAPGLLYAYAGFKDLTSHKNLPRNFPVAVRIRYLLEGIRPEIRQ